MQPIADQAQRTERIQLATQRYIERLRQWALQVSVPSSLVLVVYLVFLNINVFAVTQIFDVPLPEKIEVHEFGDSSEALRRIKQENFTTVEHLNELSTGGEQSQLQETIYRYAPLFLVPPGQFPSRDDTFIGVYYTLTQSSFADSTATTIKYWYYATDESGGTVARERLALFGQPIDRELIYQVRLFNGEISSAHYQAPFHRLIRFNFDGSTRPIFLVASANNNFRLVRPFEPERWPEFQLIAPLPHSQLAKDPAHDPDFVALAAREALIQHEINLSEYVYAEFQNPVSSGRVTVSVLIDGRWYYLHQSIAGLTRPGYNQIGIYTGFTPQPVQIEAVRIVAQTRQDVEFDVLSIFLYPYLQLAA